MSQPDAFSLPAILTGALNTAVEQGIVAAPENEEVEYIDVEVCNTGAATHFHEIEGKVITCIETCPCGKPSLLGALFNDEVREVTLALQAPPEGHPAAQPSEHPRLNIHLNPGHEHSHEPCLNFDVCGVCFSPVWEHMFATGGGLIGIHNPEDETQVATVSFRVADFKEARASVAAAKARHTPPLPAAFGGTTH